MNGSKSHEPPPLSKPEVPDTNQFLSGHNYSFWILPNPLGKTQKIPMQGLWEGFLPGQRLTFRHIFTSIATFFALGTVRLYIHFAEKIKGQ